MPISMNYQDMTFQNRSIPMIELWIALVLTWNPSVQRVIDKEFNTEKECWDYYETEIAPDTTLAEGKWGKQNLTSQSD